VIQRGDLAHVREDESPTARQMPLFSLTDFVQVAALEQSTAPTEKDD